MVVNRLDKGVIEEAVKLVYSHNLQSLLQENRTKELKEFTDEIKNDFCKLLSKALPGKSDIIEYLRRQPFYWLPRKHNEISKEIIIYENGEPHFFIKEVHGDGENLQGFEIIWGNPNDEGKGDIDYLTEDKVKTVMEKTFKEIMES